MNYLEEKQCYCPYCGEPISLLVDGSLPDQRYVEDCQVCCQPMLVSVSVEDEEISCTLSQENE